MLGGADGVIGPAELSPFLELGPALPAALADDAGLLRRAPQQDPARGGGTFVRKSSGGLSSQAGAADAEVPTRDTDAANHAYRWAKAWPRHANGLIDRRPPPPEVWTAPVREINRDDIFAAAERDAPSPLVSPRAWAPPGVAAAAAAPTIAAAGGSYAPPLRCIDRDTSQDFPSSPTRGPRRHLLAPPAGAAASPDARTRASPRAASRPKPAASDARAGAFETERPEGPRPAGSPRRKSPAEAEAARYRLALAHRCAPVP